MQNALELFASRFTPPRGKNGEALSVCIPSLTGSADAFLALTLTRDDRLILAITPGQPEADRLADDLKILSAKSPTRILELPPKLADDKSALGTRLKTIAALKARAINPYPCVVVASFPALVTPIATSVEPIRISLGGLGGLEGLEGLGGLVEKLAKMGYERLPQVEKEGDCSVRGGIVDFWSPGDEFPVRAEFFGDDLESLRTFNPATQTSIGRIETCEILPVEEEGLGVREEGLGARDQGLEGRGMIFDLLPTNSTILALEHNSYNLSTLLPAPRSPIPAPRSLLPDPLSLIPIYYTGDPAPAGVPTYDFQTTSLPGFAELGADEAHHPELFDAARKRLNQHIAAATSRGDLVLRLDDLSGGFELAGVGDRCKPTPNLLVVTKSDRVFAKRTRHASNLKRQTSNFATGPRLSDFDDLEPGEYVVHVDYGVGRYIGSSEILVDGRRSEVFTIEYADGGKLHVPAAHAHLLSRYVGVKGEAVRLHRLDGKRWEKDKKDAQKAVADLAAALLETQAKRETVPGFAYDVHCDGREAFDAAFPYEETADQLAAIAAIEKDLAATKPMDRLVCGDAGYGKTEVAMRAAFIAAMNGRQTAVLAPTTVLAEQHYETFLARFDGTPIRIEAMSRFQGDEAKKGTRARLLSGATDIVIGTHALLSSKVNFHDLGLIVIDEEQRFGVKDKEHLKRLRATADVLTMSATPIPRTLYLSMTGARDLSLLRTPPRERVATETKIVRDTDQTVRTAIERELARGGQVYFLHNRVLTIEKVAARIRALVPGAKLEVAHGQMSASLLATKMQRFARGKANVLLCTTIVESGLDIPRANTILVDRADHFGIAELYQLRGRVGRSSWQGYAYFLLPEEGSLDAEARERLDALRKHAGLGAGFNLALRDLEIRGAGNLLGSAQSGHIAAVGFQLYCQLLQRTIARLKGDKVPDLVDVTLNLDFLDFSPGAADLETTGACLPYDYVEEEAQRMDFHRRLAETATLPAVRRLRTELADRYGRLPKAAVRLMKLAEFRVLCARAGVSRLDVRNGRAVFYRTGSPDVAFVGHVEGATPERKLASLAKTLVEKTTLRS